MKIAPPLWLAKVLIPLGIIVYQPSTLTQLLPDATMGEEGSVVTPNVELNQKLVDLIEGGAIRDANLFHSFTEFNVNEGQNVYFANPQGITNILTRITGADVSDIFGVLGVNGAANLFIINPNGILFGANVQLDIAGSFVASTADSVLFDNGWEFSATSPQAPPLLTVNIPIGLQYGQTPGSISLERVGGSRSGFGLTLSPGKTVALVGGEINLSGASLNTPGGRIEIGSVAGEGLVSLTPTEQGGWIFGYEDIANFDNIQILRSFINTSIEAEDESEFPFPNSDGAIAMRGSQIDIGRTSVVRANTFTSFPGGEITIDATNLIIRDGAAVSTNTFSDAPAGNLTVNASESVTITGGFVFGDFGFASSLSTRTGGVQTGGGVGEAGNLTINTKRLLIEGGAQVSATTIIEGNGGKLTVNASESVQLRGTALDQRRTPSALLTNSRGIGNAGELIVNTPTLQIQDSALISASTSGGAGGSIAVTADTLTIFNGAQLITTTAGNSDAGNINLMIAESINLAGVNSGIFANTLEGSAGNGGSIIIDPKLVTIRDGAQIAVNSAGSGTGGSIELEADFLTLDNGLISAATASNQGGNISLAIDDILLLRNGSNITATAGTIGAGGDGGNVNINTTFLVALPNEDSNITANAFLGNGGNVQINAQGIFGIEFQPTETDFSDITASSEFGTSGTVVLNTPDVDVIQGTVELASEPVNPQPLEGCQGRGGEGSFVQTGRGGIAVSPYEKLESSDSLDDLSLPAELSARESRVSTRIVEARNWIINDQGAVVLVSQMPACIKDSEDF